MPRRACESILHRNTSSDSIKRASSHLLKPSDRLLRDWLLLLQHNHLRDFEVTCRYWCTKTQVEYHEPKLVAHRPRHLIEYRKHSKIRRILICNFPFMMHLLLLPDEILLQILGNGADHDLLVTPDFMNLSLVNKPLRKTVKAMLYRKLNIKLGSYSDEELGGTDKLARGRLLTEPGLGGLVRDLSIQCVHGQITYGLEACINCLKVTPNVQELTLGYGIAAAGPQMYECIRLLQSGAFQHLHTLTVTSSLCGCMMLELFLIPNLKSLHLGYYSPMEEERCPGDHRPLIFYDSAINGSSSVESLSISCWQPGKTLAILLKLPKKLVHFSGSWRPWDNPYSAKGVSDFLSIHGSSLETLHIGASLDKADEYEPQYSDGTLASFVDYGALRELRCHVDVLLGEEFSGGTADTLADRLPSQLEKLKIYYVPRMVSDHAHKPDTDMGALDSCLVWVRSLARAKHERNTALRYVTFNETTYLPGPLEGPYLSPKFSQMHWREDEQTAWSERGPYPLRAVGIKLRVLLVFVVRGWIRRTSARRPRRAPAEIAVIEGGDSGNTELQADHDLIDD